MGAGMLARGSAGEHLVCAELLIDGHRAFLTTQDCPYDVVAELAGRLVRIQVKTTARPRGDTYFWSPGCTDPNCEFDLVALVALDIRRVVFMSGSELRQSVNMAIPGFPLGKQMDFYTFDRAASRLLLSHEDQVSGEHRRGNANAWKTDCPIGHPYTEENTYTDSVGRRSCKTCNTDRARERRNA